MTWINTSKNTVIARRREEVAALRLRGLTQRQIQEKLAENIETRNPKGNKAWSLGTINKDIAVLEDEWRSRANNSTSEWKAQQLAEIREARTLAWSKQDLRSIERLLKLESDITGTAAPARIQVQDWRQKLEAEGYDPDELLQQATGFFQQALAAGSAQ